MTYGKPLTRRGRAGKMEDVSSQPAWKPNGAIVVGDRPGGKGDEGRSGSGKPAGKVCNGGATRSAEPLRRRPIQRRSARRVERMLDACAELLDEGGYDALSTTRVAERAGVAIGSVYQFFPDKRALSQALARRNVERFIVRIGRRFITEDYAGWWDAVDAIIDEYVEMHRTVPGFRSLHFREVFDRNVLDSDSSTVIAGRLRALLLDEFGFVDGEDLDRAILVAVEAGDAVLKLAFRHDPSGAPEIVAEAKQLVRDYLSRQLRMAQSRRAR